MQHGCSRCTARPDRLDGLAMSSEAALVHRRMQEHWQCNQIARTVCLEPAVKHGGLMAAAEQGHLLVQPGARLGLGMKAAELGMRAAGWRWKTVAQVKRRLMPHSDQTAAIKQRFSSRKVSCRLGSV